MSWGCSSGLAWWCLPNNFALGATGATALERFHTYPEFEARMRASFAKQGLMKTIGAQLTPVSPGAAEIEVPLSPATSQQAGIAHGGALVAIADSATGYAELSLMPARC